MKLVTYRVRMMIACCLVCDRAYLVKETGRCGCGRPIIGTIPLILFKLRKPPRKRKAKKCKP